jgi:LmbE family N-acetylglucosaminyl deacetylase
MTMPKNSRALGIFVGLACVCAQAYEPLPQDTGATGTYQKLLKLRTIASVMHTTAHPDDEHGGMLAWLSRGLGARVSLMTLTRGQSGDNALGPQLFDGLGLIRTEELLVADRYYGVDAQYFTNVIDYGFSKRLDEALEKWGRENVLRDVVRIIRTERPLVLVSRFQGNERDGHGNHQTAGLITVEAFRAAGDPKQFPEQITAGLRPWQPRKVYIGGVREDEPWNVRIDAGQFSPWLGMSYADFARVGLSFQRSQNSGRLSLTPGPQYGYYKRVDAPVGDQAGGDIGPSALFGARENGLFDGISKAITGLFSAIQRPAPAGADAVLRAIAQAVDEATQRFTVADPSACVPALARGLNATRAAMQALAEEPDAAFILQRKEAQFMDAINTALGAVVRYRVGGAIVEAQAPVQRREARPPYGYALRELRVVPAIAVMSHPATVVVPIRSQTKNVRVSVDVLNNRESGSRGEVTLRLPQGWTAQPARVPFTFARAGERSTYGFEVSIPSISDRTYQIEAIAIADGREYREGYETIEYRDLEARHLYRPSATDVRGIDVERVPGLSVGYVMGIGDQVPEGIRQLGYAVTMLDENELARGNLSRFDAIVTGTRAYAVRDDLKTYSRRLLDYVEQGGNLIVLYNTQEFVPAQWAPKPGELTARAEEVSEEDSPVDILAADAQVLAWPNKITKADFANWVEQRGSKFWSTWDPAYRPIVATWDRGQAPQQGGWLWTRHGKGHYTYFAYAMHRQLPYGVPGAYRLMANLLAQGRTKN